ncbi:MAG: XrtA-associated tyrosine autokinase [Rhizobacter sp.]
MSIIEQAARRLEELRRAGIDIPEIPSLPGEGQASLVAGLARPPVVAQARDRALPPVASHRASPGWADTDSSPDAARSKYVEIDLRRLAEEGYLTPDAPRKGIAEELRTVKRPIIEHAHEARLAGRPRGNLILVTSALPAEGKTYCAINLAMSIAMEVDHSVLLVDADVVHPSVMTRLGVDAELGMLDVLTKPSLDLSDVLLRTNVPKLTLLPAGSATAKSTEILASGAMEAMLAEVAARYSDRIVIFDAPPLLLTSESRVLATRMGQVLMVVQAQKTVHSSVKRAFAELEACDTVWCVLNKATSGQSSGSYGRYAQSPRGDD